MACFFNNVRETNAVALRYFPRSMLSNFLGINCGALCENLRHSEGYPLRLRGKFNGLTEERKRKREMPLIIKSNPYNHNSHSKIVQFAGGYEFRLSRLLYERKDMQSHTNLSTWRRYAVASNCSSVKWICMLRLWRHRISPAGLRGFLHDRNCSVFAETFESLEWWLRDMRLRAAPRRRASSDQMLSREMKFSGLHLMST